MLDCLTAGKMASEAQKDLPKRKVHPFAHCHLDLCVGKCAGGHGKKFLPSHIMEHIKHYSLFESL